MGYKPIIHTINDDNFIEIMYQFVESWYEFYIPKNMEKICFGKSKTTGIAGGLRKPP